MVDIRIDTGTELEQLIERTRNLRPALERAAEDLQDRTGQHFDRSGSGRWPELHPATLTRRARAGQNSNRILEVSGRLRRSLTSANARDAVRQIRGDELVFGSTVPYAPYVARRRPPIPEITRDLAQRMSGHVADHIFGR